MSAPRQRFATPEQEAAENAVAARYGSLIGVAFRRMPERYFLDFMGFRGGRWHGLMEVKVRPGVLQYRSYDVRLLKVLKGRELAAALGVPAILMLDTGEDLRWVDLRGDFTPGWVTRNNPRDAQDDEPAACFAWDQFRRVREPANDRHG